MKPFKIMISKYIIQKSNLLPVIFLLSGFITANAQPEQVIDQVAGVVGDKILLMSEVETQYLQILSQGADEGEELRCRIIDQLLINKLLLNQAIHDSLEVSDAQVNNELDRRIGYMVNQIGSESRLEEYYEKSIPEIRNEFKPLIKDQLLMQIMQGKVTENVSISPADVREFYNSIPPDSLPFINAEIEYAQIVVNVPVSAEEKERVKSKMEEYRKRIQDGEDFSTLAILYSQDGSAKNGGELGFVGRGELVPEFESTAFKLRKGEVSEVVETQFGFHIIQLIERRGELINVRHILIKPSFGEKEINETYTVAERIYNSIVNDTISFEDASQRYSDDKESRYNGGNVVNPNNGLTRFSADEIDPSVYFQLEKMEVGEISKPIQSLSSQGNTAFRILYLKNRTKPHKANLKDDYQRIQDAAKTERESQALIEWVQKKKKTTYVQVAERYNSCPNLNYWFTDN